MRFQMDFICAWYDLWVGAYWDRRRRWLYIFPAPMLGVVLKFPLDEFRVTDGVRQGVCLDFYTHHSFRWDGDRHWQQVPDLSYRGIRKASGDSQCSTK